MQVDGLCRSLPRGLLLRGSKCSVIHPDECIDCGVCEPECPVDAIKADTEPGAEKWLSVNAEYARLWPNISLKKEPPADAKEWERVPDKAQYFSANPGADHNPKSIRICGSALAPSRRSLSSHLVRYQSRLICAH